MIIMDERRDVAESTYRGFRAWSFGLGGLMILLGLLAIILSATTTFATMLFLGAIIAARGIFELIYALAGYRHAGFWRTLFGGVLSVVIGLLILSRPEITAAALTLLVAAFLVTGGLFRAVSAPIERNEYWVLELAVGVISLLLGLWVWSGWPTTALWFIGLLVGIEILVRGIALVALPFTLKWVSSGRAESLLAK
ncbi:MAG: HdeD family acid-resistance protein [Chitinivibrionales bacterium]|nr:HdeD family acid-resistance protein [Chitinivibrionales bacterium]